MLKRADGGQKKGMIPIMAGLRNNVDEHPNVAAGVQTNAVMGTA